MAFARKYAGIQIGKMYKTVHTKTAKCNKSLLPLI